MDTTQEYGVPRTQIIHDIALEVAKITLANDGVRGLHPDQIAAKLWKAYDNVLFTVVACANGATHCFDES